MPIIAYAGEKGGPGKTALCINSGVCLMHQGHEVALLDADKQRSTAEWAEQREALARLDRALSPIVCFERTGDMYDALESLGKKYEYVLVDVTGAETPQMSSVLMAADIVVSPFVPSACDLKTARAMNHAIEVTKLRGNPALRSMAVLNQVSPRAHEAKPEIALASELLEPFTNLPIAECRVSFRRSFRRAYAQARGVVEMADSRLAKERESHGLAASEMWALFSLITGITPREVVLDER